MAGYATDDPPHKDDCTCECHQIPLWCTKTDQQCGSPPDYGFFCCYGYKGSPKRAPKPACGLCGTKTWRVKEIEGLSLCRDCRRAVR